MTDQHLGDRLIAAATIMSGLLAKYHLKIPSDQEVVAKLSVELTDKLISELLKAK